MRFGDWVLAARGRSEVPYTEHQQQRIFYTDSGAGPPIILGHSFLCTGEMWRGQTIALADRYRLINPDFRGHGQSDRVHTPFGIYDAVNDALGVLNELGIDQAIWCGLSIGGMVAMRAALVAPERVAGLILLDTDAGAETWFRTARYRAMGLGARTLGVAPFVPAVSKLMFGATTRRENPALVAEWSDVFGSVDVPSMLAGLAGLVGRDSVHARLGEISVPCLVMVGAEDVSLPVARSQRLHDGLPNSELVVVPEAGHLAALEQPDFVNARIESFLQRV